MFDPNQESPREAVSFACGTTGVCLCYDKVVNCSVPLVRLPVIPSEAASYEDITTVVISNQKNISNFRIPDEVSWSRSLTNLTLEGNELTQVPLPIIVSSEMRTLSLANNKISSLGRGELSRISGNLTFINIENNPVVSVSIGAFDGLPIYNLTVNTAGWLSSCSYNATSQPIVSCRCAFGYATDPLWPSYCGKIAFFYLKKPLLF